MTLYLNVGRMYIPPFILHVPVKIEIYKMKNIVTQIWLEFLLYLHINIWQPTIKNNTL